MSTDRATPNGSDPLAVLHQIHAILDGPKGWSSENLEWIEMAMTGAGYVIHDPSDYCQDRDHEPPVLLIDGMCPRCEADDTADAISKKDASKAYTFTVTGPVAILGAWSTVECSEYLWGAHSPEPLTKHGIEELVGVFDECSPITWHGSFGVYEAPVGSDDDEVGIYTIKLEEVSA